MAPVGDNITLDDLATGHERLRRLEAAVEQLRGEVAELRNRTLDPLADLATPQQIVDTGIATMGQLREHLKFRSTNGLGRYVSERGRRLRISRKGYAEWWRQRRG